MKEKNGVEKIVNFIKQLEDLSVLIGELKDLLEDELLKKNEHSPKYFNVMKQREIILLALSHVPQGKYIIRRELGKFIAIFFSKKIDDSRINGVLWRLKKEDIKKIKWININANSFAKLTANASMNSPPCPYPHPYNQDSHGYMLTCEGREEVKKFKQHIKYLNEICRFYFAKVFGD